MPIRKKLLSVCLFFTIFTSVFWTSSQNCFSQQDAPGDEWASFQTAYFNVFYKPEVNLKRVLGRLHSRSLPSYSNLPAYTLTGIEAKVAYRLDTIFMRVRDILGMYPDKADIKIKIFKNRQNISAELCFLNQTDGTCKSFYTYRFNSIYTSEQDVTDSVIAHEMAHAVVDNYFSTTPPEKMAEILATNVDFHLDD
jgi:uncharacterized protein (DUF2132 family)